MAGLDPAAIQSLMSNLNRGKGGGGDSYGYGGEGGGGDQYDPQTEYDLSQADMGTIAHYAGLGNKGMGPNTSMGVTMAGNRRAARAEAYNNQLKELELLAKLANSNALSAFGPSGAQAGYEAGQKEATGATSPTGTTTTPSGYSPQGSF